MGKTVLLDVDEVICDFIGGYLNLVFMATGKTFNRNQVTDWSFKKCLGLSEYEVKKIDFLMQGPGWIKSRMVIPGAWEGIELLSKVGYELVFVTSPYTGHPSWGFERKEWLYERWPSIPVVITKNKEYVEGDFMVDDKPSNLISWSGRSSSRKPIIWDQPYNRTPDAIGFRRASTWKQVLNHIYVPTSSDRPLAGVP